jgi:hypothetical protein
MPEVEEDSIDTHTEGNNPIEAHCVWRIQSGTTWDLSKKIPKGKRVRGRENREHPGIIRESVNLWGIG